MPLYEHVLLARQDISAQQVESMIEKFQAVITDGGGTIGKSEYWGLKGLAYKIKKNRKAHFALFNIDAPHDAVAEMERQMRLSTDVIRFMTLKVAEHDNDPSPIMKRGDRDDRRGGRRDHRPPATGARAKIEISRVPQQAARKLPKLRRRLPKRLRNLQRRRQKRPLTATREKHHEHFSLRRQKDLLPPPENLPFLKRRVAQNRLQGRQIAAALCFRARKDRTKPHNRGFGEKAARIGKKRSNVQDFSDCCLI